VNTIVFLLEEPSAQDALQGFLPSVLPPEVSVEYLVFEGKQDLEKRMVRRIGTHLSRYYRLFANYEEHLLKLL
jgi:hypothetical protein